MVPFSWYTRWIPTCLPCTHRSSLLTPFGALYSSYSPCLRPVESSLYILWRCPFDNKKYVLMTLGLFVLYSVSVISSWLICSRLRSRCLRDLVSSYLLYCSRASSMNLCSCMYIVPSTSSLLVSVRTPSVYCHVVNSWVILLWTIFLFPLMKYSVSMSPIIVRVSLPLES